MPENNAEAWRFGGPGSSHQDRDHPGKNRQDTGHKGGGDPAGAPPDAGKPTNPDQSRVSGGGGERDAHHRHTGERS